MDDFSLNWDIFVLVIAIVESKGKLIQRMHNMMELSLLLYAIEWLLCSISLITDNDCSNASNKCIGIDSKSSLY